MSPEPERRGRLFVGFALLVGALVLLGCLRPALPSVLRDHWSGMVVLLAGAACLLQLLRAYRSESRHEGLLVALLPLALAALFLQPQRVASDGIFYFAPLRSLVVDFDLDFENEYRVLGAEPGYFQRTATGRLPNHYSIGPALLWLPAYLAAHVLGLAGLYRPTGFGYPYFTAIATTTAVIGFWGVLLLFRLIRSYFEETLALVATLAVWLATFHLWYMVFEPSMSHALAMTTVAGFLLFTHRGIAGRKAYALAGAAGALVALIRWQNVVFLPVALAVSWANHGRAKSRELAWGAAAFLLVFSPQLLYWKSLYGSFLLVPQGGGYIDWAHPKLEEVLFSSRHGLLSWAPVLWISLAGVPGFVRRAPALGLSLAAAGLLALYVNASVFDWWAGASFGSRRFDGLLPAFGLGLATSFEWLAPRIRQHPVAATTIGLAPFVLWNFMLMGVYFTGAIPPDGPASFQKAAADGIELFYRGTGYPFSWPPALRDRILHGRPLSTYDLAGSRSVSNNVDIRMGDTDALHLGRGWSLPRRGRERTWRDVDALGSDVFVALAEPVNYQISVDTRPGGRLQLDFNGDDLGVAEANERGSARWNVPTAGVRAGVNRITLRPAGGEPLAVFRIQLLRGAE